MNRRKLAKLKARLARQGIHNPGMVANIMRRKGHNGKRMSVVAAMANKNRS